MHELADCPMMEFGRFKTEFEYWQREAEYATACEKTNTAYKRHDGGRAAHQKET